MSALKSSRSRAPAQSLSTGTKGQDIASQLDEKLRAFRTEHFEPAVFVQSKCQTMSEKEIRHLCAYLLDLKRGSAEEMRRSVYANYASFIRTSREISDLEGELLSIRNLLSNEAALIHGLAEGVRMNSIYDDFSNHIATDLSDFEDNELSDFEKWSLELPDVLDVLRAERRIEEALAILEEGEQVLIEAREQQIVSKNMITSLHCAIAEHRQGLADQLAESACQPSVRGIELRSAVSALKKLGDGPRAHKLLLNVHDHKLVRNLQNLHPSSTSYGGSYTAALAQVIFSGIAQAANDSVAVFCDFPAYTSELVVWATKQAEDFAVLVKKHALTSAVAAGGLRAAAECIQIALGHCSLLEDRGLALCPILLRLFRPTVEQALSANLKRIEESTIAVGAADDWTFIYPPVGPRSIRQTNASLATCATLQPRLSSSAHRFNLLVQELFEDMGPLLGMHLEGSIMDGLLGVFTAYVNLLITALPGSMEEEMNVEDSRRKIVRLAETERQQVALLANASLLADDLLPRAAMKLSPIYVSGRKDDIHNKVSERQNRISEHREWKRKLQRVVDGLRDSFCRQHALDLIFMEDGSPYLSAQFYINMEKNMDETEWSPSPIFQELFIKLNLISGVAADIFAGRERFATQLIMRLTETVILWLADDQTFWDDLVDGPKPIGLFGLKQFYLDMEFVSQFASQGRYLSRNLHQVVKGIISRALTAYSTTGIDPYSVLPEDEWFTDTAQEAIGRLAGKGRSANERELYSPTASISAHSVSSFKSHGSS